MMMHDIELAMSCRLHMHNVQLYIVLPVVHLSVHTRVRIYGHSNLHLELIDQL
jgi:hypothetical protein